MTRRDVVRVGGIVFMSGATAGLAEFLLGCGAGGSVTGTSTSSTSSSGCEQATNVTRGPYFIDEATDTNIVNDVVDSTIPQRSDIRSDTKGGTGVQAGLPLTLNLTVGSYSSSSCSAIAGAQVDIWHCNAQGIYSDVQASTNDGGTDYTGENFLRGYQVTDANGAVSFTTIYPGWYSGRTVHIHIKVRLFNSSGVVTTEATTQLFFDEATSTAVYAANSGTYKSGTRDTLNTTDAIYKSEDPALLVALTGSTTVGYTGTISIGITPGSIYGG